MLPPLHIFHSIYPSLLRRRRCRWCRFCGWRRSRPAHPRPGRRNFISQNQWNLFILCTTLKVFLFSFFWVFVWKQRKPLGFDAISRFHLAHFMISICKKISSKENQTTETWRNLHSTFHQKKSSKSSSHYLTWNTYSAFILTFLHHSTRILMLLMQLMQLSCHQIGIWNEIFRVGIPNVPCQAQGCTVTIVLCPGHSHLTVSHLSNLFWHPNGSPTDCCYSWSIIHLSYV